MYNFITNKQCYVSFCQVVYQNKDDQVTVVAAGVTLHEALAAAEHLKKGTMQKKHCFMGKNIIIIIKDYVYCILQMTQILCGECTGDI